MHHNLPSMSTLSDYLKTKMKTKGEPEEGSWEEVRVALENGDHIENALEGKILPDNLLAKIVNLVCKCVNEKDMTLLNTAASNDSVFPLGKLLSGIFRSTQNEIHIVTTNYDRVAEYACNSEGILFQTGFAPGYVQRWEGTGQVMFKRGAMRHGF